MKIFSGEIGEKCHQSCLVALVLCTKLYIKLAVSLCSFSHFSFPFNFRTADALVFFYVIAILDIWKTTLFYEGESVVYDGFKYVWPVKPPTFPRGNILLEFYFHRLEKQKPRFFFKKRVV